MGMVTLHLVIGVGVFILPLFLLLFSLVAMSLAHLYIVIGSGKRGGGEEQAQYFFFKSTCSDQKLLRMRKNCENKKISENKKQ
jgi:hypothetical protein